MKKLKVLLIAYNNLGKGGIQNQIMGIVRSLKDRVDFDIVIWDNVKDYYSTELKHYGVKIIPCFREPGKTLLRRKADAFIRYGEIRKIIEKVIREYGPYDAIHCNNAYDAAPCLQAAHRAGIPVRISHAHNTENPALRRKLIYPAYRALYQHNRRIIRKYATHMIGCSKQVTDYFFGKGIGQVVHIGIDLSKFQHVGTPERNSKTTHLLHVGSMSEQKNQLFLVEIMEELVKHKPTVHLTMIGGGQVYLSKVRTLVTEKGLDQYICIMSPETSVPEAMTAADLFVFPSTFEGFGIVLIEAQSLGLRCFASDIVSQEANCGGIRYLPLAKGAAHWSEMILKEINNGLCHIEKYDVSKFSVENMSEKIYTLYSNDTI